jgi:outer membrane receptor protein involved in Fe transport
MHDIKRVRFVSIPLRAWFLASAFCFTAAAQTATVSGSLTGTVTDSTGAVIPGAQVRILNIATNHVRMLATDDQGVYRASDLAVGTYEVRVEQAGFTTYLHRGITLSIGQTVHLDVTLVAAAAAAEVTVTEQPSAIDASQTASTTIVDTEKIEELPVRSRNYLNFVLLAPGVATSSEQSTAYPHTQQSDSGFTFGGLRARSNNLSIDGVDNNDEFTGSSRVELSLEIVREFQVVNNGLSAEFGGASGGSINVVTKSGTNQFHGDAFVFAQDRAFNAREPLTSGSGRADLSRYRAGLALGGPLVKDHTFFYMALEQEHTRAQNSADIDPAVATALNTALAAGAFPGMGVRVISPGFFPVSRAETEVSGKLNHQTDRSTAMLRYAFTNNREAGDGFNNGGLTDASARGSSFTGDHALVGSLVSVLSKRTVSDLRFQLATRLVALRTNDQAGPEVDIAGLINFGRPYEGNDRHRENHYEGSYTITQTRGPDLFKAGVTINHVQLRSFDPDGFGAVYVFRSLTDFLTGRADSFRQAFGDPNTHFAVTSFGGFLQDHRSLPRRLTLDLGLRYDFERLPGQFNQDTNNLSPRVGIAYSPSDRWVLRAGYGVFHDRYVLAFLNRAIDKNGVRAFEQVASGPRATAIFQSLAGAPLVKPSPGIRPSIFQADPRMATPYSQQANLGVERLLTRNLIASATYLFVRGVKLARTRNVNLQRPQLLTAQNAALLGVAAPDPQQIGREVFGPGRLDSRFNAVYQLEDSARSTYHGLTLALNRRLANEFEFSASYTFSKTLDDASDFDEQPENPFDLRPERALSRNHQEHRFVFSALYDLPFGEEDDKKGQGPTRRKGAVNLLGSLLEHIEVAPILTVGSGRPVNPLTGTDSNRSDAFPISSRPLGFVRNSLKTPSFVAVDLRVLKYLPIGEHGKLDFVAEAFNLFNRTNVSQINPVFGLGNLPLGGFGVPVEAFNARHLQFSIDFEF